MIKKLLISAILFFFISFSYAQTVWNGLGNNSDWNDPANWSAGVPLLLSSATIQNAPFQPVITAGVIIVSLNIDANASLTIDVGGSITTSGSVVNNGILNLNAGNSSILGTLTNSTTGTINFLNTSNLSVVSTTTNNGIFLLNGGSATLTGSFTNGTTATTNILPSSTLTMGASATNNGIFSLDGGNVTLTGSFTNNTTGTTTVATPSVFTMNSSTTNNGTLSLTGGNITLAGIFTNASTGTTTATNSSIFTLNSSTNNNGIFFLNGGNATLAGILNNNATGAVTVANGSTLTVNAAVINNGTFYLSTGNATITGDFTNANALTIDANRTFNLAGNFIQDGTLTTHPTSIFNFTGTGNRNITGAGANCTFGFVNVTKTAILNINRDIRTASRFRINGNVSTQVILATNVTLTVGGDFDRTTGAFNATTNAPTTVVFDGTANANLLTNSLVFHNLTINKASATNTVTIGSTFNVTVNNQLNLISGQFVTLYSSRYLILAAGATYTGGNSNTSFVSGPMRKIGNTSFIFPIGKNNRIGRVELIITAAGAATDYFTTEYFTTPFGNSTINAPLSDISDREYWRIERSGTTTASVKLYWETSAASGFNAVNHTTPPNTAISNTNMRVAQWSTTNSQWENRGGTGTITSGTVPSGSGYVTSATGQGSTMNTTDHWTIGLNAINNLDWGTVTWLGGTPGNPNDWHTAANWSPSTVPTILNDVYILGDRPVCNITTANAVAKSLNISRFIIPATPATTRNTLTIGATRTLTVGTSNLDGTITNFGKIINNGTLRNTNTVDNRGTFASPNEPTITNNGHMTLCKRAGTFTNANGNNEPTGNSNAIFTNNGTVIVGDTTGATINRRAGFDNTRDGVVNNPAASSIVVTGSFRNINAGTGTATLANGGNFIVHQSFTNDRNLTGNGLLVLSDNQNSTVNGTGAIIHNFDINKTGTRTVTFDGAGGITVNNDLDYSGNANVTLIIGTNRTVTLLRNFNNQGALTANTGSTVNFAGNAVNSVVSGNAPTFHHITNNKLGGLFTQFTVNVTANGNVTNTSGELQVIGSNIFSIAGDFQNDSYFIPNTSNVRFIGGTNSTVSGNYNIGFYDLTINKTAGGTIEEAIFNNPITIFHSLTFLNDGLITTTPASMLTIEDNVTATGADARSYVNGRMRKIGDDSFVFPVGRSPYWAPIEMSNLVGIVNTDVFEAEYFYAPANATPNPYNIGTGLNHVSDIEYWDLHRARGVATADVTIYWKDALRSEIIDLVTIDLRVGHYDGALWQDQGGVIGAGSTVGVGGIGKITANFTSFSPITFATKFGFNPLPITLLNFSAGLEKGNALLKWSTATEIDNDRFVIERSTDVKTFETIGEVKGAGNSRSTLDYNFTDETPYKGISYYRLKQIDFNGAFSYSDVVSINNSISDELGFNIFPNPLRGEKLYIYVEENISSLVATIQDLQGRILYTNNIALVNKQGAISLNNELPGGIYILKIDTGSKILSKKITVR